MERKELKNRLKEIIVETLNLKIDPKDIGDDTPFFGNANESGIFDNSLAVLEVTSVLIGEYDIDPSDFNNKSFENINSLAYSVKKALKKKNP